MKCYLPKVRDISWMDASLILFPHHHPWENPLLGTSISLIPGTEDEPGLGLASTQLSGSLLCLPLLFSLCLPSPLNGLGSKNSGRSRDVLKATELHNPSPALGHDESRLKSKQTAKHPRDFRALSLYQALQYQGMLSNNSASTSTV